MPLVEGSFQDVLAAAVRQSLHVEPLFESRILVTAWAPASQVVLTVTLRESVGFGLTLTLRIVGAGKVAAIVSQ